MNFKSTKLTTEDYLKKVDGKMSYVWDPNSIHGNQVPVKVVMDGEFNSLMMERPISAVLVIFSLIDEQNMVIRNMVDLPSKTPLLNVLNEINKIVEFAKKNSKKTNINVGDALEVHLIPTEFY